MRKRLVAIFTGGRSEYGLLKSVIEAVAAHPDLEYRLFASDAHFNPELGDTKQEIYADNFKIDFVVEGGVVEGGIDRSDRQAVAKVIGRGIVSASAVMDSVSPDFLVVYGDRYEAFAVLTAATQMRIASAHIEGGDMTEGGALDDSIRHAMTKLAHLHFTTNAQASARLLQMGEEAWRVANVGLPAIDLVVRGDYAPADEVAKGLTLDIAKPIVVFTQHSVTTEPEKADAQIRPSLSALRDLAAGGVQIVVTYPNGDVGSADIVRNIENWPAASHPFVRIRRSLGQRLYHGLLALARLPHARIACVGNSSSGIKETAVFGCPTVNIGSRQDGRLRARNVIDVGHDEARLRDAVRQCLFDEAFRAACRTVENPYGSGTAGIKIAERLATVPIGPELLRKRWIAMQGAEEDRL